MKRLAASDFRVVLGVVIALSSAVAAGLLLVESELVPAPGICRAVCG